MRRNWIVGAATALVLVVLLAFPSVVTVPGTGGVMAAGSRTLPTEDEVRFVVERPEGTAGTGHATLVGRLRTDDPTFSGAFELVIESIDGRLERRALLEIDDAFRFDDLAPGPLRIELREPRGKGRLFFEGLRPRVHRPYPRTLSTTDVDLAAGESRVDVVLGLDPVASCRVIGWLVGTSSDPRVHYRVRSSGRVRDVAPDGSFDLGFLEVDRALVTVLARVEGVTGDPEDLLSWFRLTSEPLELEAGGLHTVQIEVPRFTTVTPAVRERGTGRGVANARIEIVSVDEPPTIMRSGPACDLLLTKGRYDLTVMADGFRWARESLVLDRDDDVRLAVELERAEPRPVLLLDPDGAPLRDARVTVVAGLTGPLLGLRGEDTMADGVGIADLGFLPGGRHELRIRAGDDEYRAALEPGATTVVGEDRSRWPGGQ